MVEINLINPSESDLEFTITSDGYGGYKLNFSKEFNPEIKSAKIICDLNCADDFAKLFFTKEYVSKLGFSEISIFVRSSLTLDHPFVHNQVTTSINDTLWMRNLIKVVGTVESFTMPPTLSVTGFGILTKSQQLPFKDLIADFKEKFVLSFHLDDIKLAKVTNVYNEREYFTIMYNSEIASIQTKGNPTTPRFLFNFTNSQVIDGYNRKGIVAFRKANPDGELYFVAWTLTESLMNEAFELGVTKIITVCPLFDVKDNDKVIVYDYNLFL